MHYELYIDVLFVENFMMDSLLLLTTRTVLKNQVRLWRCFCGGASGSAAMCMIIALPLPGAMKYVLFYGPVFTGMLLIGLDIRTIKGFLESAGIMYAASFLMGGILQALRPYIRITGLFFTAAIPVWYLLTGIFRLLVHVRKEQSRICRVVLITKTGEYGLYALLDTGNLLNDFLTGEPVSVIDRETAERIFSSGENVRYIPYQSVGGESIMPVIRAVEMQLEYENGHAGKIQAPLIGICDSVFSKNGKYQIIINPDISGGTEYGCKSSSNTTIQMEDHT